MQARISAGLTITQ